MKKQISFLIVIIMMCLASCAILSTPEHFTPAQKVEYTTLKTLESAKTFREFALESAGSRYKQGLMDESTKEKIIKIGDELQLAINTAADALIAYKNTNGLVGDQSIAEKIGNYQAIFNQFMEAVTPYVMKTTTAQEVV